MAGRSSRGGAHRSLRLQPPAPTILLSLARAICYAQSHGAQILSNHRCCWFAGCWPGRPTRRRSSSPTVRRSPVKCLCRLGQRRGGADQGRAMASMSGCPWANFSQEDLKKFAKIPKLAAAGRAVHRDYAGGEDQEDRGDHQAATAPGTASAPIPARRALFVRPRVVHPAAALRGQYLCRRTRSRSSARDRRRWSAACPRCCRSSARSSSCPCPPR